MASIVVAGDTSGTVTLAAPAVSGTTTLTLPTTSGTIVTTSGAQTIEFADGSASAPSITNSGDTNTGMFFPAADTIAFAEGGTEAMRLDASGNVGIGVTPSYKFEVQTAASGVGFTTYSSNETAERTTYTAYPGLQIAAYQSVGGSPYTKTSDIVANGDGTVPSQLRFWTKTNGQSSAAERMRIDSSGNVGIGTSGPNAKLDVVGQILTGSTGNNAVAINSSGSNYGFISNPSNGVFALGYGATIGTLGTSVATWNSSGNFGFNSGYGSVATAYGCRAWVNFNGTGTVAIRSSGNVSSITDNGTGAYTINFTSNMPDANYAVAGTCMNNIGTNYGGILTIADNLIYNNNFKIFTSPIATTLFDPTNVCVSVFR